MFEERLLGLQIRGASPARWFIDRKEDLSGAKILPVFSYTVASRANQPAMPL